MTMVSIAILNKYTYLPMEFDKKNDNCLVNESKMKKTAVMQYFSVVHFELLCICVL